tara:strand:+ start:2130 stop:2486 length:357 start_codon:yes stop_codon:yes gene_type:complete
MNSYNEITKEEAEYYGFLSMESFFRWQSTLEPRHVFVTYEEEEEGEVFRSTACLYTDGDGGVMEFKNWCEIFEEHGMKIALRGCTYCDIEFGEMEDIAAKLEGNAIEDMGNKFIEDET